MVRVAAHGLRYDKASGLWHRKGDQLILDEVQDVYGNIPVERSDVVLDLGGHIGAATRLLLRKGAARSVAVEADPVNVAILRKNMAGLPVTVIAAAVGPTAGRTTFYTRADRSFVGSTIDDAGRTRTEVPVVAFGDLLAQYRPSIVKCDIEFSEYGLPWTLPDHVRIVAMEVHIRYVGIFTGRVIDADQLRSRRAAAAALIATIDGQGFRQMWRKDKQARPDQIAAEDDGTGIGPMTKCACITWIRP